MICKLCLGVETFTFSQIFWNHCLHFYTTPQIWHAFVIFILWCKLNANIHCQAKQMFLMQNTAWLGLVHLSTWANNLSIWWNNCWLIGIDQPPEGILMLFCALQKGANRFITHIYKTQWGTWQSKMWFSTFWTPLCNGRTGRVLWI